MEKLEERVNVVEDEVASLKQTTLSIKVSVEKIEAALIGENPYTDKGMITEFKELQKDYYEKRKSRKNFFVWLWRVLVGAGFGAVWAKITNKI